MTLPNKVKLVEVGPRDGLQNEPSSIDTQTKLALIQRLCETGLSHIEVTSFVSPKWVPQLSDAKAIYEGLSPQSSMTYSALIPNLTGFDKALQAGVKHIAVFTAPSESFTHKNTHMSVSESLKMAESVCQKAAAHQIPVRGYISCVLGCPYEGDIPFDKTQEVAKALIEMGCYEVSLGDTIGIGTPIKTQMLIQTLLTSLSIEQLAVHFHDTYGQALANIYASLQVGVSVVDASIGGLGGCPYAKGASGNVATEDVLYLLNGLNIETGVSLEKLVEASWFIHDALNRTSQSKVALALKKPS